MEFIDDILICPGCLSVETKPAVEGDTCICGDHYVSGESIRVWLRTWNKVGSVVAAARQQRRDGGHHLAVYGAIGKCLIDMPEWNGHEVEMMAGESAIESAKRRAAGGE